MNENEMFSSLKASRGPLLKTDVRYGIKRAINEITNVVNTHVSVEK